MSGDGVGAIDFGMADYLGFNGIYYHPNGCNDCSGLGVGRAVTTADLDRVVARVDAGRDPWAGTPCAEGSDEPVEEMTARIYPLGTEVWAVTGHDPGFRLAVVVDGEVSVYEANCGPGVETGADLFDFARLERIEVRTGGRTSNRDLLATVSDPADVAAWASMIEAAPAPGWNDPTYVRYRSLSTVVVVFVFADGTVSSRRYDRETGILHPLVQLPAEDQARVENLIATAPPTEMPAPPPRESPLPTVTDTSVPPPAETPALLVAPTETPAA
jgi:hypothetical protein